MNIGELHIGQIIKNYKELCMLLDIKIATGNTKISQLKELHRFCNFDKQGNKFIIKEIYEEPLPKEDNRAFGNNSEYSEYIQNILLCVLYKLDENEVIWSCNTLLKQLSMINSNYIIGRRNMEKLGDNINIEKEYVYDFYSNTHTSLKQKLESALNILCKRSLITCEKILMITKERIEVILNEFGTPKIENNKICYKKMEITTETTTEERQLILQIEVDNLNKLNVKNKSELVYKGLWNEFSKAINKELNKNNIKYSFYAYRITFNRNNIAKEVMGELGEMFDRNELNVKIINCLIKGATTRHENASKGFGIPQGSKTKIQNHKLRSNTGYVEYNKKLVDELIKIKK